jgi:hypothetical protein
MPKLIGSKLEKIMSDDTREAVEKILIKQATMTLRDEVAELKQEVANLKNWAVHATQVIQNMQETDGCDHLRLP